MAKRLPHETELAQSEAETALVVGYMRYYLVHSTYAEIRRVDGESLGGSIYAATVPPGRRLIVVRMTQVSALNPLIFGESSCAFDLEAVPNTTYQLTPPDMKAYRRFWSRLPGTAPKRFETTLDMIVSAEGAEDRRMEIAADCGDAYVCRTSADCGFMLQSGDEEGVVRVVCERDLPDRLGLCVSFPVNETVAE